MRYKKKSNKNKINLLKNFYFFNDYFVNKLFFSFFSSCSLLFCVCIMLLLLLFLLLLCYLYPINQNQRYDCGDNNNIAAKIICVRLFILTELDKLNLLFLIVIDISKEFFLAILSTRKIKFIFLYLKLYNISLDNFDFMENN